MRPRNRHDRLGGEGATLERVRLNEAVTHIAFGGRRRRVYARIVALSGAGPGDRVLDVGCGGGYLARLLAAAVAPDGRVTGLDTSAPAIGYARRRTPANCTFTVGAAQDLDLPDGSFDVVTSTLAAHHISEAARQDAFGQMYRVLRPGGTLLVADFRPSRRRQSPHARVGARRHGDAVPLEDLADAAGFRVEDRGDLPLLRYVRAVRPAACQCRATAGEGTQNLLCAYLAAAVLAGLLANTVLGWWWLDPVVALGIAGLAVREGIEAWHGEECGC